MNCVHIVFESLVGVQESRLGEGSPTDGFNRERGAGWQGGWSLLSILHSLVRQLALAKRQIDAKMLTGSTQFVIMFCRKINIIHAKMISVSSRVPLGILCA